MSCCWMLTGAWMLVHGCGSPAPPSSSSSSTVIVQWSLEGKLTLTGTISGLRLATGLSRNLYKGGWRGIYVDSWIRLPFFISIKALWLIFFISLKALWLTFFISLKALWLTFYFFKRFMADIFYFFKSFMADIFYFLKSFMAYIFFLLRAL